MAVASYWLPALRRWLPGVLLLSLLTPLRSVGQPRPGYRLTQLAAVGLPDLGWLPTQLAVGELLAAEALGYVAGTPTARPRTTQLRAGSWWAWLGMALLSGALLWMGLALRTARRFNQELATHVGYLMGYLYHLPAAAPAPELRPPALPAASSPIAPPEPLAAAALAPEPAPFVVAVPEPIAPAHQQQAAHELRQAAEAALADADFGPAQLAEQLALGERTLYRYIKELTGLTPAAYLRELRLQHAHHLLETQACPSVAEVAYQSGFNDPSYFGQVFQKRFGKKPSAYL